MSCRSIVHVCIFCRYIFQMLEDTDGALGKKVEEIAEKKKEKVDDVKERSRSKEKSSRKHKEKKGRRDMHA